MKKHALLFATLLAFAAFTNCRKTDDHPRPLPASTPGSATTSQEVRSEEGNIHIAEATVYSGFPETFESGTKTAYAAANVTLATGVWNLDDALIGNSTSDRKNGAKSVRMQNTGKMTMQFDAANGVSQVTIAHATFGTDAASTWTLWYSTNSGSTWTQTGGTITTSGTTLATATFSLSISGNVRFQVRKTGGGRLNIDDLSINDNAGGGGSGGTPTQDDNMAMGNPSGATTNTANTNNYLLVKTQYALAYNNARGIANWVSWHLSTAWKGSAVRCDCFTQDATLPSGYFRASTSNYTGTGFDRGHMCPSDDRDLNDADNAATFKMTNIEPQAPSLSQDIWGDLETYCRTLITQGNELYIIAGNYGQGGSGANGGTINTIASGQITVPSHYWKVIVVLPVGTSDLSRVTTSTRVIAIDMPNTQTVNSHTWGWYRTTVNAIEASTGYDILSNVPTSIQSTIESVTDAGPTM